MSKLFIFECDKQNICAYFSSALQAHLRQNITSAQVDAQHYYSTFRWHSMVLKM